MARVLKQVIPAPPAQYDQVYIAQLADAINRYIFQREAQGEMIAARYISTDAPCSVQRGAGSPANPTIPADDVHTLATGTLILKPVTGTTGDANLFLTVVTSQDAFTPPAKGNRSVK